MKTKTLTLTLTLTLLGTFLILVGSSELNAAPVTGVVGYAQTPVGSVGTVAPNIPFVSAGGKQSSLYKIREPVTILVFTAHDDKAERGVLPELAILSKRLRNFPITVVQVSQHEGKAGHEKPGHLNKTRTVLLIDEQKISWKAYGQPKVNSVYLIDKNGKILAVESLGRLDEVAKKARRLGEDIQAEYEEMYYGG